MKTKNMGRDVKISKSDAIRIVYYLMAVDGEISLSEEVKFEAIAKLIEQNATVMDFVAAIHEESHTLTLDMREKVALTEDLVSQLKGYMEKIRNEIGGTK